MRKRVSVREFQGICSEKPPKQILYCSENQEWYRVSNPAKFSLSFCDIKTLENPNTIYLRAKENIVYFDRVRYIDVDDEQTVLGRVFVVTCGDSKAKEAEKKYTLIAL